MLSVTFNFMQKHTQMKTAKLTTCGPVLKNRNSLHHWN